MSKVISMIREFGSGLRNIAVLKIILTVFITAVIIMSIFFMSYSENMNKGLADNLIRLHVVANSEKEEDQELKRDIRDMILNYMKIQLKDSKDIEQTKYIIQKNLPVIEYMSEKEIMKRGMNYTVKATLGSFAFPTKAYGDIILPAGNYQALKVVIGKGEGTNWWCVLFPPLCFVDATQGTVPEDVKQKLRDTLTEDEYKIISLADSDSDIPIKIRFKVVEFFQYSKIRFTGLISKIFKQHESNN